MSLHGIDTKTWQFGRAHLSGTISTPDEVTLAYISVPPSASTAAKGTILLIHGFPETSHQFKHVLNPLAQAGYHVIAPDYRGAGESSHPPSGFDKLTMASDLHRLIYEKLSVKGKIHVVGHDIGGMIAHAFAVKFPNSTQSVIWGECPLPGTSFYNDCKTNPATWHFVFHWQADLPELLVTGNEKQYLKHFFTRLAYNHNAITNADQENYATLYAQPGGLRCGFNCYRAFHQDEEDNKRLVREQGKCKVPCCSLTGKEGFLGGAKAEVQTKEMYADVECREVEGSGHWIAEENPGAFVREVLGFVGKH